MCSNEEKRDEFAGALKACIAKHSLEGLEEINNRIAILLEKHEVLASGGESQVDPFALSVLLDANHSSRVSLSPGPLLMYSDPNREQHRLVLQVEHLLLNHDPEVRSAAIKHFSALTEESSFLWPHTENLIKEICDSVVSVEEPIWRDTAIRVFDRIENDLLCNLAAVEQSVSSRFDQGFHDYLPRVLTPSVESLSALCSSCFPPSKASEGIAKGIEDAVAHSPTLALACHKYYREIGHVPLTAPFDMATLFESWFQTAGQSPDLWQDLWSWADSIPSPLPRYHLCCAFAQYPELIPPDAQETFWLEIEKVLHLSTGQDPDSPETLAWNIRCDLARYYVQYMECLLPGQDGEIIAMASWWLAEQVATIFSKDLSLLEYLRTQVSAQMEFYGYLWKMASSPIRPCLLRHGTVFLQSIWHIALVGELCRNLEALDAAGIPDAQSESVANALLVGLLAGFPLSPPGDIVYSFDTPMIPAAEKWLAMNEGHPDILRTCVNVQQQLTVHDSFLEHLDNIAREQEGSQIGIAQAFRLMASMNETPSEGIWDLINTPEWRDKTLAEVDLRAMEILYDAFAALQVHAGGQWLTDMPHIWALACEACPPEDGERRHLLFVFTVSSCMAADSTGAVRRLLTGDHRHEFHEFVSHARSQYRSLQIASPQWLGARFRALMAALHIS